MKNEKLVRSLNPQLRKALHWVSVIASFFMVWSILAVIQALTVGMIPGVWGISVGRISVAPLIFSIIAFIIAIKCGKYNSPYA